MFALTPLEIDALILSLRVALVSVLASLPIGLTTAIILSRWNFSGKWLLDGIVHLPLVLPPVVIGYILLLLFGRKGIIGEFLHEIFNVTVVFTWKGAAIASAVMAFPLMVRAIKLSLDTMDRGLEGAARTLGAGKFKVLATITIPLCIPGILTGTILSFARSLGEFGATITFVSNIPGETQTLPLALYNFTQIPGDDTPALRLLFIAVIIAFASLVLSDYFARRVSSRLGLNEESQL